MATKKVLVEINVEQKGNSIPKTTKEVDKLAKATERLKHAQSDEAKQLAILNEQTKRTNKQLSQYAKEQVDAANATENTNDKMQKFKTTSGLTGAIVTEFGRTASDASYGIRGMGNNISQIVTLFGQLQVNVAKAGGNFKDALSQIFQSMKGIIGLMTALQIVLGVIQAEWFQKWAAGLLEMTGLMDLFSSKLSKLKSEIDGVADEFGGLTTELEVYTEILENSTRSVEDKEKVYKKIIDKFPELESSIKRVGDEFIVSANAVEEMKNKLEELALSSAALNRLSEISSEKLEEELKDRIKINESIKDSNKLKKDSFQSVSDEDLKKIKEYSDIINNDTDSEGFVITQQQRGEAISNLKKIYDKSRETERKRLIQVSGESRGYVENVKDLDNYIESLEEVSDSKKDLLTTQGKFNKENQTEIDILKSYIKIDEGKTKKPKDPLERRVSRFKEARLLLQSELQKSEEELKKTTFRTNKEIIQDEGESSKDVIKIKTDEFKKREELRLTNFINQKRIDRERKEITQAEKDRIDKAIEEAEETSAKTIRLADEEATKVIESITRVTDARILNRQRLDELNQRKRDDSVQEGELGLIASIMSEGMQKILAEENLAQIRYDNKVARANEELALDTLTEDQRRDLETQKSLWSQQKAQEDLDFDIATIEERFRIQQEYIGFVSQTSGILQAIGNKNKEWQKTQLILEKGAAIAGVVTQAAKSISVQTSAASTANQLIAAKYAAIPTGSIKAALEIKANTALYRKGVTKTKAGAGLSIAAITAGAVSGLNSISNSGGGSSGGGGGSATVQPPDFNIVGSTGVNQLADAIGSTEKQPVKAFVVASDVTTQQSLDRNNRNNAEL